MFMHMIDVATATYCVGPLCYVSDQEAQDKEDHHPKPSMGTGYLVHMLYNNICDGLMRYLGHVKQSAYEAIMTNYLTLMNQILVIIALVLIGKTTLEFIRGRHRTPQEEARQETGTRTSTVVNINNAMRCETGTHTQDGNTDIPSTEKQSAVFHRMQGPRETIIKYGNDLSYLGGNLFKDDNMLKYIFVRGLRNPKVRERVVEKYLTDQKVGSESTLKELISYAVLIEEIVRGTESLSAGEVTTNEDENIQYRKKQVNSYNNNNPYNTTNGPITYPRSIKQSTLRTETAKAHHTTTSQITA